jgi:ABC-type branched-subunit amino acid transport system substrate-binding protein
MKKTIFFLLLLLGFILPKAQEKSKIIRAGLFTAFYLDSAFDTSGEYRQSLAFPRQAIANLEFYEGAVMAIDSLNQTGKSAILEVYDISSTQGNIEQLLKRGKFDSLDIMFVHGGPPEYTALASISKSKNIPLVSASYPNDGGIRGSPMVYIANPKINSHLQIIVNQMISRWEEANIIWFNRSDPGDDRLEDIFRELIKQSSIAQRPQYIKLGKTFSTEEISKAIDSTKINVLLAGSLDNTFAVNFAKAISTYEKKGIIQVIGMPNWDGLKELQSTSYAGIPIYYTSGMSPATDNKWAIDFDKKMKEETGINSSTSALKGFELTFYFLNILSKYGTIKIDNPADKPFKVFNDLDFRAIKWTKETQVPDYFENKRIYFIRRLNSVESVQ